MLSLVISPVQAGVFRPMLNLMRPRLERTLNQECKKLIKRDHKILESLIDTSCRSLALEASECLIEQTSHSRRELEVIRELVAGKIGVNGEAMIKQCLRQLLGLPTNILEQIKIFRPSSQDLGIHRDHSICKINI